VSKLCAGADVQGFVEMDNPHDRVKIAFQQELLEVSRPAPALGRGGGTGHIARRRCGASLACRVPERLTSVPQ
jgi:hypothetical protein